MFEHAEEHKTEALIAGPPLDSMEFGVRDAMSPIHFRGAVRRMLTTRSRFGGTHQFGLTCFSEIIGSSQRDEKKWTTYEEKSGRRVRVSTGSKHRWGESAPKESIMDGDTNIAANMAPASEGSLAGAALAEVVIDTLAYVAGEIKAGRFAGHRKRAPKTVILHNCKFSIRAIRMLGMTGETQIFALRALYPSIGRVERDLFPVIADLLLLGTEDSVDAGRPDEPNSGPRYGRPGR